MHYLYLLYSPSLQKYYIGQSHNVKDRLNYHNSADNSIWTNRGKPWNLVGIFIFPNAREAIIAERFIKNQKSRKTIEKIIGEGYLFKNILLMNQVRAPDPG